MFDMNLINEKKLGYNELYWTISFVHFNHVKVITVMVFT
jgi:hypothetical protein